MKTITVSNFRANL